MNKELKKAIMNYLIDNEKEFQIINTTIENFRQYIYTPDGRYCYGGQQVHDFIVNAVKLLEK